jgi:hypothetical protein
MRFRLVPPAGSLTAVAVVAAVAQQPARQQPATAGVMTVYKTPPAAAVPNGSIT